MRLVRQGIERLYARYRVTPGGNELKARIPASLGHGVYQLHALADSGGRHRTLRDAVVCRADRPP